MYVGLGVASAPVYAGAGERRASPMPVLQVQWSNGVFISGTRIGVHLSGRPGLEFGPLFNLHSQRTESGMRTFGRGVGDAIGAGELDLSSGIASSASFNAAGELVVVPDQGDYDGTGIVPGGNVDPSNIPTRIPDNERVAGVVLPDGSFVPGGSRIALPVDAGRNRLKGMDDIRGGLEVGGFLNYYLAPDLRLATSMLYGAGAERDGLRVNVELQKAWARIGAHHSLSLVGGATWANQAYMQNYFGVTEAQFQRSLNRPFAPQAGFNSVHVGAHWNWSLSGSWLLASSVVANRLTGDAAASPLVARRGNVSISTALAYRF